MNLKEEKRLLLRLHEHNGEGITLFKTSSHPMEIYDRLAHNVVVAIDRLSQQKLDDGLLSMSIMQELAHDEYAEKDKVYAAFPENLREDIITALSISDGIYINPRLSLTTRQRSAVNQMISGIFWGMHSEIIAPELLV